MTRIIPGKVLWLGRTTVFCVGSVVILAMVQEDPFVGTGGGNAWAS